MCIYTVIHMHATVRAHINVTCVCVCVCLTCMVESIIMRMHKLGNIRWIYNMEIG